MGQKCPIEEIVMSPIAPHPLSYHTKFDYRILVEGEKRVRQELDFLTGGGTINPQDQDFSAELQCKVLNLALECYEKGLRFLPADQAASDLHRFIPEGNAIRLPLDCL